MGRDLEQKRAGFAYQVISEELANQTESDGAKKADKIKSEACKAIALVLNNGFLKAMDFTGTKLKEVYPLLKRWLAQEEDGPGVCRSIREAASSANLGAAIARADSGEYRHAMQESIAFLGQLKSKAEGMQMELEWRETQRRQEEERDRQSESQPPTS